MITREAIQQRIDGLQRERQQYLEQAQRDLASYDGAIKVLEDLIGEMTEDGHEETDGIVLNSAVLEA